MNLHQLPLVGVLVALAGSIAHLALLDTAVPPLAPPGSRAMHPVQRLYLKVPGIAEFADYYGVEERDDWRNLNPFIPARQRAAERQRLARPVKPVITIEVPADIGRPQQDAIVVDPPSYPALPVLGNLGPEVLAVVASSSGSLLRVRLGEVGPLTLRVGEEIEGWTLVALGGGVATFTSPDDSEVQVPLEITGVTVLASGERPSVAPSPGPAATEAPAAGDPALGQMVIDRLMQTPQGRRALESIPGLRERILANPRQAMRLLQQQQQGVPQQR